MSEKKSFARQLITASVTSTVGAAVGAIVTAIINAVTRVAPEPLAARVDLPPDPGVALIVVGIVVGAVLGLAVWLLVTDRSKLKRLLPHALRLLERLFRKKMAGMGGNAEAEIAPEPGAGSEPVAVPDGAAGTRIAISSGHGARVPGAVGILDEVTEARRVVGGIVGYLREMGAHVDEFHDDESDTVAGNIGAIVNWHNSRERDMDVSVHFNAFAPTEGPMGTEVLFLSAGDAAARVSRAIAEAGGFRNRGAKFRDNLGFLNRTEKPAILLEICFVDSAGDAGLYRANFDAVCRAAASALGLGASG